MEIFIVNQENEFFDKAKRRYYSVAILAIHVCTNITYLMSSTINIIRSDNATQDETEIRRLALEYAHARFPSTEYYNHMVALGEIRSDLWKNIYEA